MKKIVLLVFSFVLSIFISACSSSEDMTDYVDVSFSGVNTMGMADYDVNEEQLFKDVFDYDDDIDFADEETLEEMENLENAYKIQLDKDEGLSNDDTVKITVSVDDEQTDKIKAGEKKITVKGLEEPEVLTSEDVEDNLVLNFTGASGRGSAEIENTFNESPLNEINFEIKNNGELENENQAEVTINEESEQKLHNNGYILDENFTPEFKVEELYNVAENPADIENLDDIKRMLDEEVERQYSGKESIGITYKYKKETMMYRQFNEKTDDEESFSLKNDKDNNGNLVGIYSVEESDKFDDDKEFTAIIGFSDIKLDDDGKADLSEMETISSKKDDIYSLKSVIQSYESKDYEEIKN